MKKDRIFFFLLIGLYITIFIFTMIMQWIGIQNQEMRLTVNISMLLLTAITGALFYYFYNNDGKKILESENEKETVIIEEKKEEELPSKEAYIKFANEYQLTKRETEIGWLVVSGYSNQQVAEELYISETTVKKHLTHVYEKTGTSGRKEFKGKFSCFGR